LKPKTPAAQVWATYEQCKDYDNILGLGAKVSENERFYRGVQWDGAGGASLPKPVFNVIRRIINYYSSSILSSSVAMRFSYSSPFGAGMGKESSLKYEDALNKICEKHWETQRMDELMDDALHDAAITGDAVAYTYWDPKIKTGQKFSGDFRTVLLDNTDVFFGCPILRGVKSQPWIIIAASEEVESLREAAKNSGRPKSEIELITPEKDKDGFPPLPGENNRAISLIKLWKNKDNKVMFAKYTKSAVVIPETDTGLAEYPICVLNWTKSKTSWHGEAAVTGLIENQTFINKAFAMVMKHMMDTAFSKVVYDGTIISEWTNRVGEAVKVDGPVENVAKVVLPGQLQPGMLEVIAMAINATKESMGATETALGEVKPENTSAILALQKASSLPLETVKRQFYRFVEDIGLVWLDFINAYYGNGRLVRVNTKDGEEFLPFEKSPSEGELFDCRVDVGASSYYSEIAALNTLDNLLSKGLISVTDYLERVPQNIIPKKDELIKEIAKRNAVDEAPQKREDFVK